MAETNETGRKAPPRNEIIPEKMADAIRRELANQSMQMSRLGSSMSGIQTRLDGIVVDQDVQGVAIEAMRSNAVGQNRWTWIRDIIVILLLLVGIGFMIYRGYTIDHIMRACELPQG